LSYTIRVVKGGALIFIMSILATALGYLLRLFLARNLSVEEFGLFYAVSAFVAIFWLFKDIGTGHAVVKFIPELSVKRKFSAIKTIILFLISFQFFIGFILFTILILFSDYIAINFFHSIQAKSIIQIFAIEIFFASNILKNILQGLQKIKEFASIEFFRLLLIFFVIFILLPVTAVKVAWAYVIASLIIQIIFLFNVFSFLKNYKLNFAFVKSRLVKRIFKFSLMAFIGSVAGTIISYTDTLVLTFFRTTSEVGIYQVALPTSQLLWVFATSLSAILFPILSEMWAKNEKEKLLKGVSILIKLSFVFMIPLILIILSFPKLIINILFGSSYLGASTPLQILSVGAVFYTLMLIYSTTLYAIGKPEINTKIVILVGLLNLIMNILLVPILGVIGASLTSLLSFIMGFLFSVYFSKKFIRIKIQYFSLLKAFIVGMVSLSLIYFIKLFLVVEVLLKITISLLVGFGFYIIVVLYIILDQEDYNILKRIMPFFRFKKV